MAFAPVSVSATGWGLCGGPLALPQRPAVDVVIEPDEEPGTVHIAADQADLVEDGRSTLVDDVQILRGTRQMQADRVLYHQPTEVIDAIGGVRLWDEGMYATGVSGQMRLLENISSMQSVTFLLQDSHARGEAGSIELEGDEVVRIKDAHYTTCNPGDAAWFLEADYIRLDKTTDIGLGRNVWVHFHGVPVFYTPFITFPLSDKRKTGFLSPSFGISSSSGVEATVPFYWNIAPEQDATFAARGMSERGVMLQGEYRYLADWGTGLFGAEFLPDDSEFGDSRSAVHFDHRGDFAPRWNADVNFDWVSDDEYFEDLGTDLAISSSRFLERRADVRYSGSGWWARGRVQNFQTVDRTIAPSRRPYEVLPQLLFVRAPRETNREFNLSMRGEAVYFERSNSVTGGRVDLTPTLSFPMRTAATFIEPRLSLRHTAYTLDGTAPGTDASPSRTLPIFSTDAGLFMERELQLGGGDYVQTLEPRAYYLYVPHEDQSDLPVFDTGVFSFNFSQLFRNNRFSGADRLGDANQLTLAVSSRLLAADGGRELARASIGQIYYLRDRQVTLPGRAPETQGSSDLIAEVAANIADRWRASAGLQWDIEESTTDKSVVSLRWQPDRRTVVNAGYRFVRDASEQTDFSFRWPVNANWSAIGRWNYALADERTLEVFGGIEYESCCWAVRAVARRHLATTLGEYNTGLFVQLELKGLAGVATGPGDFLERSIPGYQRGYGD